LPVAENQQDVILKLRIASATVDVPEVQDFDESVVEVWRDRDGVLCAWAQSRDGERWMHLPGVASYRLQPGEGEVTAIPHPSAGPQRVISAYQRTVLPMALQLAGREVLHASGVLAVQGAVAFCAVSMTGKSTLAHEFSRRGYGLWGDDAVAFDTPDGSVTSVPLPFELQLRAPSPGESPATTAAVPELSTSEARVVPLAAVCVVERTPSIEATDRVRVRRLPPAEAFPAVLAHAYCYSLDDVERNRRMIAHYLDLSGRVPAFSVNIRAGLEHLAAVVEGIERAVGMAPRPIS
jgi:hypothetical protein